VTPFRTPPIDATIARISRSSADGYGILVKRRKGPGDGWFAASELGPGGSAPPALLARVRGLSEPPADHIRAEWLLESLARAIADLGGSFLVGARQLPDMSPGNVLLAAEGGLIRATGMMSERITVIDSDLPVGGGREEITTVADWPDLADQFREGFVILLEPMVDWLDDQGLRPKKTLWHAAADRLAQSLVWSGKAFDQREFARQITERVVGGDPRLQIPLATDEDEYGDQFHLRATCCLAYRTPEGGLCRACPLQKAA